MRDSMTQKQNAVIIELLEGDEANIRIECADEQEAPKLQYIADRVVELISDSEH